jgi:hypothetical protein
MIELLVVVSVIAVLVSLVLPALSKARQRSRAVVCTSNLRQLGAISAAYSSTFRDAIGSFSWRAGVSSQGANLSDADLISGLDAAQSPREAQVVQFVHLLRTEGGLRHPFSLGTVLLPHLRYTHLPILSFEGQGLRRGFVLCPQDKTRLSWQDPQRFESLLPDIASDMQTSDLDIASRIQFTSSYIPTASAYQTDVGQSSYVIVSNTTYSGTDSNVKKLGQRRSSEVTFPSQKVWFFEDHDRHQSDKHLFFSMPFAQIPLLMFDGSAQTARTSNTNRGIIPGAWRLDPTFDWSVKMRYAPRKYLSDLGPSTTEQFSAHYMHTKGGLKGVDIGSPEIDTRTMLP